MTRQKSVFEEVFGPKYTGYEGLQKIRCPKCGEVFACRRDLVEVRQVDGNGLYCPNGHSLRIPSRKRSPFAKPAR